MTTSQDEAFAQLMLQQIKDLSLEDKPHIYEFVKSARLGLYRRCNPISPSAIGLSYDEFTALRALVYGANNGR